MNRIDRGPVTVFTATILLSLAALVVAEEGRPTGSKPVGPVMLFQEGETHDAAAPSGTKTAFAVMRLPEGRFAFYDRNAPAKGPVSLPDREGRMHQLLPHIPTHIAESMAIRESGVLANSQVILTKDDEVLGVTVQNEAIDREIAAKIGLTRYLNTWFQKANTSSATPPSKTWQGYNGSQMEYQQLASGRLLVPHGSLLPHARTAPPFGRHETIVQFSDDLGETWHVSDSRLLSPCYPGFNGSSEGACEPAFEELADGRIWMLMRTAAGFLYESYSSDDGTHWTSARASRFHSSTGPPNILRHQNGWLVVCWNNCEMPPRQEGEGVYGGRDALHIAVSDDNGKTWRGFREIYLDHRRDDNPARTGDRGTAYPLGAFTEDGKIVVLAGQGTGGRNPILIDPNWIIGTHASTDFSDGLRHWSVYTHHGPAKRWWRARTAGSVLIPHPSEPDRQCLHVRKQPDLPADGATWNFPNGWKGSLTAHILVREGFHGGTISLNDRFFDPSNDLGEQFSVFQATLPGQLKIEANKWETLQFDWDLSVGSCRFSVEGKPVGDLKLRHPTLNGISYVRFRSRASETDEGGFLVDNVQVSITDPFTPALDINEQLAHEQRYVSEVVPLWNSSMP